MLICFVSLIAPCQTAAPASAQVQQIQNGVELKAGDINVRVQFYADGIVRAVKWPTSGTSKKLSLSVIMKSPENVGVVVGNKENAVTVSSGLVKLEISKADGSIR